MSYNGSGVFNLSDTLANSTPGDADEVNAILTDLANGLTAAVAKDGQSTMTGPLKASNGSASAPSYTFGSDTNSGFYRIGADSVGLAVNGTLLVTFDSSGITLASGDVLGTGIIKTAGLEDNAVTLAKLATQADATVLANVSGSTAVPTAVTYTNLFNDAFGSTQGQIIYKGATDWAALAPGTSGYFLKTQGAGANPTWAALNELPSGTNGHVLQYSSGAWTSSADSAVRARGSVTNATSATCTVGTGAVNTASVTLSGSTYTVTFTNALASTNYQVLISLTGTGGSNSDSQHTSVVKSTGSFTFNVIRSSTNGAGTYTAFDFVVFGGF